MVTSRSLLALSVLSAAALLHSLPLYLLIIGSTIPVLVESRSNDADKSKKRSSIHLEEDLFNRALAHAGMIESQQGPSNGDDGITERLRGGDVEALYEVAKSMNDSGDKISSVLIWHALADDGSQGDDYETYDAGLEYDYEGHVPSALALGFSYYDVDKARSLHYFLMATSKKGMPHQAAMFNAGRLYLELEDPSGALAYLRECATLDRAHPAYARPQLSITCKKAYNTLSNELVEHSDMGLEEAIECFPYAHMDNFPLPNSREHQVFDGAMERLEKYMGVVRSNSGGEIMSNSARTKATKHLTAAIEALMNFKSSNRNELSKLQVYLMGYMLERITNLRNKLEGENKHGNYDEL
mmetsp:Transcript_26046/g.62537  ORF Transcript_26046/g.62537 Transcript_26046/m.62537 type:complete len:355 (-) Transcript_26046:89-1153(-)